VRLTAEVKRMEGDTAVVTASDGGEIQIQLHRVRVDFRLVGALVCQLAHRRSCDLQEANLATKFCEIIGRVNEDLSVKVLWSMNMGDDLGKKFHCVYNVFWLIKPCYRRSDYRR
jgi:hypothetical protein